MMHYIYTFIPHFNIDEYDTLGGWAIDKWVLGYGRDVKERTLHLARLIEQEGSGEMSQESDVKFVALPTASRLSFI